jgi:aminoglycoside phosphotransferase (APT) family kinase protein
MTNQDQKFERVVQKFEPQSKLLRAWALKGGVSAQVTALEIQRPDGQTKKMIVRQHGAGDLKENPHIAADEFKLLRVLQTAGLAVPIPYHLDESGEIFPTPYLVIEYVEGESEFAPSDLEGLIVQFAAHLARIHRVSTLGLSFLPQQTDIAARKLKNRPAKVDDSIDEGHIRDVLEAAFPLSQQNKTVLLHGDFWLGNVLWKDGQLVAVIDWEDAKVGDPLADLANSRFEILWALGIEAMNRFTEHYQSLTDLDFTNLPYWDLYMALKPAFKFSEWAADAAAEKAMREGHRLFVSQAFAKVSTQ